jgi:hypothetical protein
MYGCNDSGQTFLLQQKLRLGFFVRFILKHWELQFIFLKCKLSCGISTALNKDPKLYLAGFEPGIFCFGGGLDDHYATPNKA